MLTLSLKMPLSEALAVSLIGMVTVMVILAIIACLIILVSKVIRSIESAVQKKAPADTQEKSAAVTTPAPANANQNEVELIDTDEKTAAVVMAIVAQKSDIPLNRLKFESIRLMEDEKKGEK